MTVMASWWAQVWTILLFTRSHAYVDFGTITKPAAIEPTLSIPRPHFLPEDEFMRYEPRYSMITAIAPSVAKLGNGLQKTYWSVQYRACSADARQTKGLFRRGVFQNDPQIAATCMPCDGSSRNGNHSDGLSSTCYQAPYTGVFNGVSVSSSNSLGLCFNTDYNGALRPASSLAASDLPCCPTNNIPSSCLARNSSTVFTTYSATTGIFGPSTTSFITTSPLGPSPSASQLAIVSTALESNTTVITLPSSTFTSVIESPGRPPTTITLTSTAATITITAGDQNPTTAQVTLAMTTITPLANFTQSATTTTLPNTIVGCGTAQGCGTVVGTGTVFVAPFGFPAVTSSGTVSGCAPTVIGCGTMIATTGTFTGSGTIIGCGEGSGVATMTGSGTVYPAGFHNLISFISSGTVSGSGRVVGCGTLTGSGTFWVSRPYTTTITTAAIPRPTVHVYVSYCPQPPAFTNDALLRIATATSPAGPLLEQGNSLLSNSSDSHLPYSPANLGPMHSLHNGTYSTLANSTNTTTSRLSDNPLCHICPEDSGICCPLDVFCGADGHCPYVALQHCGYVRHGVNIVDVKNSSQDMGMMGQSSPEAGLANVSFAAEDLEAPRWPGEGGGDRDKSSDARGGNGNGD